MSATAQVCVCVLGGGWLVRELMEKGAGGKAGGNADDAARCVHST